MSSVSIRFRDGTREFRYPADALAVGDVISHDGDRYRVVAIALDGGGRQSITVERDSEDMKDLIRSEKGAIVLEPFPA